MTHAHAEELALSRNFLTLEDVALLKHIGANLRGPRPVVYDLGAGSGTTALAILESHPGAFVHTFDISKDAIYWAGEAIRNYELAERWMGQILDAAEAASTANWADAVLLDASHRYEETKAELYAWAPHLRTGSWLWCHDYVGDGGMEGEENGVRRAIDEFFDSFDAEPYSERIERGLGVAFKWK